MKRQAKIVLYIILAISLVACSMVGIGRIQTEAQDKSVQIAIRYSDVLNLAQQTQESVEDILKEFKELAAFKKVNKNYDENYSFSSVGSS